MLADEQMSTQLCGFVHSTSLLCNLGKTEMLQVMTDYILSSNHRLCCIAPTLAAKVIPDCELTVGQDKDDGGRWPYAGTAGAIEQMGSKHINKNVTISFFSRIIEMLSPLERMFHLWKHFCRCINTL